MLNRNLKFKASTIMEITVALVLVSGMLFISILVISNVISTSYTNQNTKAGIYLNNYIKETKSNLAYFDKTEEVEEFKIARIVKPHAVHNHLYSLECKVYDQNSKVLASSIELIMIYDK